MGTPPSPAGPGVPAGSTSVSAAGQSVAAHSVQGGMHYYAAPPPEKPGPVVALPAAPAVFVGREAEADLVRAVLRPAEGAAGPAAVVVGAVAGLGGVGKTALALHAAHHAYRLGWFTDVVFVDLRGYDPDPLTAHQALDVLLRTLRVPTEDIPTSAAERAGLLGSVLSALGREGRRVLIVADNASSSDQIRPLLPAGDRHRLLVTSRHTQPDLGARLVDLETLTPEAGVELLRATLDAARPGDTRTHDTPEAARDLAAWCGGLPLALRISAAVLVLDPGQSIPGLLAELQARRSRIDAIDAYTHLTGTQRALRATFDLSHHLLAPTHRRLLHLLAISPGPDIGLPAATALAGEPEPDVLTALRDLTRAHLLTHAPGPTGSRWTMHDLVRDHNAYISDEDTLTADAEAVIRLLDHYAVTTDQADDHLRALPGTPVPDTFADRAAALAWLDAECDNLLTAIRTHPSPTTAHLASYLAIYLGERRRFDDAIAVHSLAAETSREDGDRDGECIALNNLGNSLQEVRRSAEAVTVLTAAADISQEAGNRLGEGIAFNNLGNALLDVGRYDEAVTAHTTAAGIYRELDERNREGRALNNLGLALRALGRFDEAVTAHTAAIGIYRETGDRHREGTALNNLGLVLRALGRFDEAIAAHTEDLHICRASGDRHGEGMALNNLGKALQEWGRLAEAVAAHTAAVELFGVTGDRHRAGWALDNLAIDLRGTGRFDEAVAAHTSAIAIFRETGDAEAEQQVLGNLALTEELRGQQGRRRRRFLRRRA